MPGLVAALGGSFKEYNPEDARMPTSTTTPNTAPGNFQRTTGRNID